MKSHLFYNMNITNVRIENEAWGTKDEASHPQFSLHTHTHTVKFLHLFGHKLWIIMVKSLPKKGAWCLSSLSLSNSVVSVVHDLVFYHISIDSLFLCVTYVFVVCW